LEHVFNARPDAEKKMANLRWDILWKITSTQIDVRPHWLATS